MAGYPGILSAAAGEASSVVAVRALAFQQTLRWGSPIWLLLLLLLLLLGITTSIPGLRVHVGSRHSVALGRRRSVPHLNLGIASPAAVARTTATATAAAAAASPIASLWTTVGRFVNPDGSTVKPKSHEH